jgi:diguanylate cyclase (GGDEF)-like protein
MIRAASEVLQGAAGPGAVLGRWGGEEFACIFAGDASTIGDAMLDALRTMRLDGGDVSLAITGSIGVAVVSDTTQVPVSDALAAADAAMYEAKAAGRDCVRVRHLLPRTPTDPDGAPGERRAPRKWKLRKA